MAGLSEYKVGGLSSLPSATGLSALHGSSLQSLPGFTEDGPARIHRRRACPDSQKTGLTSNPSIKTDGLPLLSTACAKALAMAQGRG